MGPATFSERRLHPGARRPRWATLAGMVLAAAACAPPAAAPSPEGCPPRAPEMTDLRGLPASPAVEVRYATADNFTGAVLPGYEAPRALLRPAAASALGRVEEALRAEGLGLKVWDAYRPVRATLAMVDWAERTGRTWVLDEGYVARRSGHNLGNTIDLTLIRRPTGEELDMGTPYDRFGVEAHTVNASGAVRDNRLRLVSAMAAQGWRNYEKEWWHFSHSGEYQPLDVPLGCFP